MLACVRGYREAVQLLLEAGAACNAKDAFGGTAMCADEGCDAAYQGYAVCTAW